MRISASSDKFIVVGDRVLLKPRSAADQTESGLYLPPSVQEKEKIQSGYIVKVGPGYPVPIHAEVDEVWKEERENVRYIPLQAREGDLAIYLQKESHEIEFNGEKYVILPQSAILLLIRDEGLYE